MTYNARFSVIFMLNFPLIPDNNKVEKIFFHMRMLESSRRNLSIVFLIDKDVNGLSGIGADDVCRSQKLSFYCFLLTNCIRYFSESSIAIFQEKRYNLKDTNRQAIIVVKRYTVNEFQNAFI